MRRIPFIMVWMWAALAAAQSPATTPSRQTITVFQDAALEWSESIPDTSQRDGLTILRQGQAVQKVIDLPPLPTNQRDARRIIAKVVVEPVPVEEDGKLKPGDPWTRVGAVSLILPQKAPPRGQQQQAPEGREIELMRFVTGFGGRSEFTQDVTALAPLLHDRVTLQAFISTYRSPAWKLTLTLTFDQEDVGQRRPVWAAPVLNEASLTADRNRLRAAVAVPVGLEQPRLIVISTGHATDGSGGDEFVTRTHILRIDGMEVARWRPWAENGGEARRSSPASARHVIGGRELWSCDFDRSGWHPGLVVEPLRFPAPELTPGKHIVELEIVGIRPKDARGHHGYWRTSIVAVADEPWPESPAPGD
jgi:hypothetical protein